MRTVPYRTARQIRAISDRLCAQANLSVLDDPQKIGKSYSEYQKKASGDSFRAQTRKRLNFILARATSYEEFLSMAAQLNVIVDERGKCVTYRLNSAQRAIRATSLADTDKYSAEGIREQVALNQAAQSMLRTQIRSAAQAASSYDAFVELLGRQHITISRNKRTGLATYDLNDLEGSRVSELVLGGAWSTQAIIDAIRLQDFSFKENAQSAPTLLEQFESQSSTLPHAPDILVELSEAQIDALTQDGLLLNAQDQSGAAVKIMIDRNHVDIMPDSRTFVALGSAYDYYFYGSGGQGHINGRRLIQQLELTNHVAPLNMQVPAHHIKSMSLKGITIHLPDAGIERIFIPAEHVHFDRTSGTCSIDLYEHWQYLYTAVPASPDAPTSAELRQSIAGNELADHLKGLEQTPQDTIELQRRIGALQDRATLAKVKLLAGALDIMVEDDMKSGADFMPKVQQIQKDIVDIQAQIKTIEGKNKQYALAARYLTAYRTLTPIWQEYQTLPSWKRRGFETDHSDELKSWKQAKSALEHMGVEPTVEPDKVATLVKEREQHIKDLQGQLTKLRGEEKNLLEMQATVEQIQNKDQNKENDYEHY